MIILLNKDKRIQLETNFNSSEFECPCCGYAIIDTNLVRACQSIRTMHDIPVKVISGYRCPRHNAATGGAEYSRHLVGCGADLFWAGMVLSTKSDSLFRKRLIEKAEDWGIYGIGWGARKFHIDTDITRKRLTQWNYDLEATPPRKT